MPIVYQLNNKDLVLEPRLQLGNEEILRPLNLAAASFTSFRIGLRFGIYGIGTIVNAGLHIGLMKNSACSHRTSSCVEFLGMHQGSTATTGIDNTTYVYTASATYPYYSTGTPRPFSRFGSVVTVHGSTTATTLMGSMYPINAPQMFMMDFVLTATGTDTTTYTITPYNLASAPTVFCSHANFLYNMEVAASFQAGIAAGTVITGAVHPGTSLFDTVVLSWNKSTPPLDVFDYAVCRLS